FLPFALEAYAFVRALELLGLSVPFEPEAEGPVTRRIPPLVRLLVLPATVAGFTWLAVLGLEARTVDSREPRVADLPAAGVRDAAALELEGLGDVFALVRATRTDVEKE